MLNLRWVPYIGLLLYYLAVAFPFHLCFTPHRAKMFKSDMKMHLQTKCFWFVADCPLTEKGDVSCQVLANGTVNCKKQAHYNANFWRAKKDYLDTMIAESKARLDRLKVSHWLTC